MRWAGCWKKQRREPCKRVPPSKHFHCPKYHMPLPQNSKFDLLSGSRWYRLFDLWRISDRHSSCWKCRSRFCSRPGCFQCLDPMPDSLERHAPSCWRSKERKGMPMAKSISYQYSRKNVKFWNETLEYLHFRSTCDAAFSTGGGTGPPGNPATWQPLIIKGHRPVVLRPTLSSGLPLSGF